MSFQTLFDKSNNQPIIYKGKLIKIAELIEFPSEHSKIRLNFISTKSEYSQAIFLSVKKGYFTSDQFADEDQKASQKIAFCEDEWKDKKDIIVNVHSNDRKLCVYNGWIIIDHLGNEMEYYGLNGAALYTEDIPYGKIYYCNDAEDDDDFDDLIFKIEILE